MEKVIERRRNIYIYILATILFCLLGMARIDAYAAEVFGHLYKNGAFTSFDYGSHTLKYSTIVPKYMSEAEFQDLLYSEKYNLDKTYTIDVSDWQSGSYIRGVTDSYKRLVVYNTKTKTETLKYYNDEGEHVVVVWDDATVENYKGPDGTHMGISYANWLSYWTAFLSPVSIKFFVYAIENLERKAAQYPNSYKISDTSHYDVYYCAPLGFTITFNVNGGTTSISSQTVDTISLPSPGSKTGYTFAGWYNGSTRIGGVGDSWTPTADATITAHWTPVSYSISYNLNGGTNNSGNPSTYNIETATITLKDPARTGYTFGGWYSNSGLTSRETAINKGSTGNKTFYAKWTARTDTKYVVKHQIMNVSGSGYTLKDTETLKGTTDANVTPNTKSYTGFTAPSKQTVKVNADGSRVVTYSYSRNKYTATFNGNGGTAGKTSASLYYEATLGTLPTATRVGYNFKGWFMAASGGTQISASTKLMGNTTYYAQWTPRTDTKYVIKHQLMNVNGSGYTLKDTETLKGTTDTNVTPATKTYTGFTAPAKQTVNINADGSRVVTYSYSRNKYTFTLGSNASVYSHGINTSGSSASGSYYYGATITLKASPKPGYSWSMWSDENASMSRTFTMPANNLTITPQANLITYNIRYNLFKGSVSGNPATYTVETPTFTLKNPTLAGFTFLGWTSPASREAKTAYQIPKGSVGDITVSANWVSGKLSDDSLNTQGGNGSSDSGNSDNTDPDNARSKNTKTQHNNFKIG